MKWHLVVTPKVQEAVRTFPPQTKRYIREALAEISKDPWSGKPLRDELTGLYSFRTKRFRIVYQIQRHTITVVVITIGHRKIIYEQLASESGRSLSQLRK